MRLHLLMILAFLSGLSCEGQFSRENQFSLKVDKTYKDKIKDILEEYSFSWLNEITPETAVIEYKGKGQGNKIIQMLSDVYHREIISWGPVRVYRNSFTPGGITEVPEDHSVPENNQGMDVEDALQSAYTGKGITIAISDVGFNTDLIDLEKNIKSSLIYNFVDKSANVSQVSFQDTNFTDEFSYITDRGNRVASVIAAVKGNNLCSSGIAYNATLAVLKISEVQIERNESGIYASSWTTSDIISRSLVYKLDEIDIFVMAWSLMEPFEILDLLNREAIEYGAKQGRRGRGTIYVVQAGSAGNGLSNNIHTITVAGIGRFGSLPYRAHIKEDASVITSGLTDGRNLTSPSIITTSYNNKCVSSFKGLSAATAQVAGIIALGLEANPNMSLRDVQHLLVKASDHRGLHESSAFKKNGAGIMFHSVLGFGLLNASVFFNLAKSHSPVPSLIVLKLNQTRISFAETIDVEFTHEDIEHLKEKSLNYVEQILVSIKLKTYNKNMKVLAVSPSGTESVLMDEVTEHLL